VGRYHLRAVHHRLLRQRVLRTGRR
jgi:hypothetical protein